ncbi:uncharacterized protein LOC143914156 [Arctopsyche grandis]|uniref:uncharacterized protein LOC143914156 n=1 Tax=Arctopsyche grandis TaxID=121162 RepID=UPI00406D65E5
MSSIDFDKVCRICLKNDVELHSIFHHNDNEDLSFKMNFCSDTIISIDDGLPNKICRECVQLLNNAYTYKTMSVESDKKLRTIQILNKKEPHISNKNISQCRKISRKCKKKPLKSATSEMYQCDICSKVFAMRSGLIQHIAIHTDSNIFVCEICGRGFSRRDYLSSHLYTHTGEKKHACTKCEYRASQRSSLVLHERTHTGLRPYTCEVCGKTYISGSKLIDHKRQHDRVKNHKCEICSKCFAFKTGLEEHITVTHNGLKKFKCSVCNVSYGRKRNLTRHLKQKHPTPLNLTSEKKKK